MHLMGHYGWAAGWGALEPGSRLRPKTLQVKSCHRQLTERKQTNCVLGS